MTWQARYRSKGVMTEMPLAPFLRVEEVICRCGTYCCNYAMNHDLLRRWIDVRTMYGKPITIASGFRCAQHPEEAKKVANGKKPGYHYQGMAIDLRLPKNEGDKKRLLDIVQLVFAKNGLGFAETFVHVDIGPERRWNY